MSRAEGIPFTKMQGLGNDFVVLDEFTSSGGRVPAGLLPDRFDEALARKFSDRRFGIGCDQILRIRPARGPNAQLRMEVVDADGTEAEMCGNGIRAVAIYLLKHWEKHAVYRIETLAGLQKVQLEGDQVRVEMGLPKFKTSAERLEFEVGGRNLILEFRDVNMGNPHAVIFVPTLNQIPLATWGPIIERHPRFPERTNVEFVEVVSQYHLKVLVWERGAGATLACGTGGCAAAVAALLAEKGGRNVEVEFPGGPLRIQWEGRADAPVFMTGPAVEVYSGKLA